jgi:hypothetical protein
MKRTMIAIGLTLLAFGGVGSASAADCELGCNAECKQEAAICVSTANLDGRVGRQQCDADAADAIVVCDSDAIDARADCVGLCGVDLKTCGGAAKVALKQCKDQVKIKLAGCENEVATQLAADRQACSEDAADCAASCVE